jgi:hypothetical protein
LTQLKQLKKPNRRVLMPDLRIKNQINEKLNSQ